MPSSRAENEDEKKNRPSASRFKQQRLPAWQPILTPIPVIGTFIGLGIIFVIIGAILLSASNSVVEYQATYVDPESDDVVCPLGRTCSVTLTVEETMEAPVYFYYRLENFYQNHRLYVQSRSDDQLAGDALDRDDLGDCEPVEGPEGEDDVAWVPCGLIALSMFNDTFTLLDESSAAVNWTSDGIAWESDLETKFATPDYASENISYQWIPQLNETRSFTDPDFVVWMRTAALPDFRKLYRIIDSDITPGTYTVIIDNIYPVEDFDGKKSVVLSTVSWMGGKNNFLAYAYLAVGVVSIVQGVLFLAKHLISPRKLGDAQFLEASSLLH